LNQVEIYFSILQRKALTPSAESAEKAAGILKQEGIMVRFLGGAQDVHEIMI
jgi:hypothetical protein